MAERQVRIEADKTWTHPILTLKQGSHEAIQPQCSGFSIVTIRLRQTEDEIDKYKTLIWTS